MKQDDKADVSVSETRWIGCVVSSTHHSHELIQQSGECEINIPTVELVAQVVGIGNSSPEMERNR